MPLDPQDRRRIYACVLCAWENGKDCSVGNKAYAVVARSETEALRLALSQCRVQYPDVRWNNHWVKVAVVHDDDVDQAYNDMLDAGVMPERKIPRRKDGGQ